MLGYLGNFIIACGCVSAFILLCCIIGLIVEKIQENEKNLKKDLTKKSFDDILNTELRKKG